MMVKTSKTCWQGFERYIAKLIGGNRSYGQSAKGRVSFEVSALGDVRNAKMLIECKLRDYAPPKFRQKYPRKPYNKFRILNKWYTGVREEATKLEQADCVKRRPGVAIKAKYGTDQHIILMYPISEQCKWKNGKVDYELLKYDTGFDHLDLWGIEECTEHKTTDKSITLDLDGRFPLTGYIDNDCVVIMKLSQFLEFKEIWQSQDQQLV